MLTKTKLLLLLTFTMVFTACDKDDPNVTVVREWVNLALSTQFENPAVPGRTETGTATVKLLSNNNLEYTTTINSLLAGDAIIAGHIHVGDPLTNGPIFVGLSPVFSGNTASGTIALRQTQADSLLTVPIYINFHSSLVPGGLIRAQMDKTIDFATDVNLSGANEIPPGNPAVTGRGSLRLMTDKTLYSRVAVSGLEAGDTLTVAHVHTATADTTGPVLIGLAGSAADFDKVRSQPLTDPIIATLKTAPVYINAHSKLHGPGVARGQIR